MRITTHMLNETAKRTGIPINQTSILSYINDESSSGGDTLLDALNKNKDKKVSSAMIANYKKTEKAAQSLKEHTDKLAATGDESFWEKIKESGGSDEAYAAVETYVERYNSTLSSLKKSTNVLDQYYSDMLKEAASDNREQLEKIGITIGNDGKLSIDKEKLNASSVEDIQNVFTGEDGLASKTSFLADRIANNAKAGMESTSNQYNGQGSVYSQYASQFDFWS